MFNLKALGAIAASTLSLCAAMAVPASAEVEAEGNATITLSGTQAVTNVLKTTAGASECKKANFAATAKTPSSSVTVTPTYSECVCGGFACTVTVNGCDYLLHGGGTTTGTVDLVCPAGKDITVESAKCIIHFGPQTGLGTITYSNTGSGTTREVIASFSLSGIKYVHTKGEGVGACTGGSSTSGTLTGTVMTTAVQDGGSTHIGIFVN